MYSFIGAHIGAKPYIEEYKDLHSKLDNKYIGSLSNHNDGPFFKLEILNPEGGYDLIPIKYKDAKSVSTLCKKYPALKWKLNPAPSWGIYYH